MTGGVSSVATENGGKRVVFFPNGFGSQMTLALILVTGYVALGFIAAVNGEWTAAFDAFKEPTMLVLVFYFVKKAHSEANGKG